MAAGDRCLLVHGHFYQPPRENPWTGQIEPQYSAAPWENWNRRIADECYIPMARSRVRNDAGEVTDLYNNYAHTSFNFGPTLLSWLAESHPDFIPHLTDASLLDSTFAMAQAYSHMMLPLADARGRHTQILWGLREFHFRFGFYPAGMWLPECGIDPETTRALIDHGVRYVILSPHQASKARPFGEAEWREAGMGNIDTRRAYRLFDIDGGGRTHFERYLDVIFYTPGLNLKVSFDHILSRPDDLARELENCYLPEYGGAQLVSIVTDGEIYGHHEKFGEEALSRLFRDIAPQLGLKVVSAGAFVRDNPPDWEVRLWNGEDGRGSSWSCQHGMGRWQRDCGCAPSTPPGWNQAWRTPLRDAFDCLRDRVSAAARRLLGPLVWDADDALDGYIGVVLDPGAASRRRFLARHGRHSLSPKELRQLWRILEALRHAMLMYTSCGWFFDEVSGLEPVQNMRYALRAAELIQPYAEEDLTALLEAELTKAPSNLGYFRDGGAVFRELVLPSRHTGRELAAAMAVCRAAGFPADSLAWKLLARTETVNYDDSAGSQLSWGSFVCHDERLDRFIKTSWLVRMDDFENTGIGLHGYEEVQGDPNRPEAFCPLSPDPDFTWLRELERDWRNLSRRELTEKFGEFGVGHSRLPEAVRSMIYRKFAGSAEQTLVEEAAQLGRRAVPFLSRARRHSARVPESIVKTVTTAFEQEMTQAVYAAAAEMSFGGAAAAAAEQPRDAARELGIWIAEDSPAEALWLTGAELLHWLGRLADLTWLPSLHPQHLPGGGEWVAPVSPSSHRLRNPHDGGLAMALGKGLAVLRSALLAEPLSGEAALCLVPLPELLEYALRLDFPTTRAAALDIEYWDFLDRHLGELTAANPVKIMAGDAGERVRRTGRLLGFSEKTMEKRIAAALRKP